MTLLTLRNEFPKLKLVALDILNVFLAILVQMLWSWSFRWRSSWKCKLGAFHPRESQGTF